MNLVLGLQLDLAWEDAEANGRRLSDWLASRELAPGSLVAVPEMFSSGFSFNPAVAAQPVAGATEVLLCGLARRHAVWLVAGLAVDYKGDLPRNEALVISPEGGVVARYAKQRLFKPGGEGGHYAAGNSPVAFTWSGIKVGLFICYDLRFPELFRVAAERWRPELFVVIANWPEGRASHWTRLLQARAIENQAWVLGVNRIGSDPVQRYGGGSLVVNPWGDVVADAGGGEGWVEAPLDLEAQRRYREKLPFLADLQLPC